MDRRALIIAGAALLVILAAAFGYSVTRGGEGPKATVTSAEQTREQVRDACASSATYDRLKQKLIEEAIKIRNADPTNLQTLAASSIVRMEQPLVKSRDEALNVTVCTGRFILELPPGAEAGFAGQRRLSAEIEYAAQGAADGSGLVYQMSGAEPIIYKLAAFDLRGQTLPPAPIPGVAPSTTTALPTEVVPEPEPVPAERPASNPPPRNEEEPAMRESVSARPSFSCRGKLSRSERMVCESDRLAGLDRAMSGKFYAAVGDADGRTRRQLFATRDRFLAFRDECRTESCIAEAYRDRMREIRDIVDDSD